jgi:hypothetical protein
MADMMSPKMLITAHSTILRKRIIRRENEKQALQTRQARKLWPNAANSNAKPHLLSFQSPAKSFGK